MTVPLARNKIKDLIEAEFHQVRRDKLNTVFCSLLERISIFQSLCLSAGHALELTYGCFFSSFIVLKKIPVHFQPSAYILLILTFLGSSWAVSVVSPTGSMTYGSVLMVRVVPRRPGSWSPNVHTVQGNVAYQRMTDSLMIVLLVFVLKTCLGIFKIY